MSDLGALALGICIGLAVVGPTAWRLRRDIRRTWGEALGSGGRRTSSDPQAPSESLSNGRRPLAVGLALCAMTILALVLAIVAFTAPDVAVRVIGATLSVACVASASRYLLRQVPLGVAVGSRPQSRR